MLRYQYIWFMTCWYGGYARSLFHKFPSTKWGFRGRHTRSGIRHIQGNSFWYDILCVPESLHFFALQKPWTSGLNNHKPTNFSLFSKGPKLQSGWDNDFQLNFKKWALATTWGHNLSYMNEVNIQNVCDMEYISNLLIY